jgi:hypothetical protein
MLFFDRSKDFPKIPNCHQDLAIRKDLPDHHNMVNPPSAFIEYHRTVIVSFVPCFAKGFHRTSKAIFCCFSVVIKVAFNLDRCGPAINKIGAKAREGTGASGPESGVLIKNIA